MYMFIINKFRIAGWIITSLLLRYCFTREIKVINFSIVNNYININQLTSNRYTSFNLVSVQPINISSEIIINGLNNLTIKKKLKTFFKITTNSNIYITKQQIKYLINKLKLSGFFEYVSFNIYYLGTHQVVVIDLVANPILNKVYIIDYENKLITDSYLLFLFRSQLGYPKSFAKIRYSINQMIKWYNLRGYKWIQINLEHNNHNSNNLIFKINEGKINKIEIVNCIKKNEPIINGGLNISSNLIVTILNIKLNKALNIKSLEDGIFNLKLKKIVSQCHYNIIPNNDNENSITLLIKIKIFNKKSIYLFANKIIIPPNLLQSLELLIEYTLDYFLFNNALAHSIFTNTTNILFDNIFLSQIYYHNLQVYTNMSKYDDRPYKLLNKPCVSFLQEMYEWYLTPLIFIVNDNFGFRHYISNINNINQTHIFDLQFTPLGIYLNFQYENPFINIFGYSFNLFKCSIFQQTYTHFQNKFPILLHQINNQCFSYKNAVFYQKGIKIELYNEHGTRFLCREELSVRKISKQYVLLYNYLSWQKLDHLIDPCFMNNLYSNFKQVCVKNIQHFLCFNFRLIYNKNHFFYYQFQKLKFVLESIHFIPTIANKYNNFFNKYLNYSHNFKFKVTKSSILKLFSAPLNKQIFISTIEMITSLGSKYHFPFSEVFFLMGPDRIRGYKEQLLYLPNLKLLVINLEYHLFFLNDNSMFIFMDYIYDINYLKNYNTMGILYNLYDINQFGYKLGYGLGMQIQTPIKQIPPLRLEYGFNMHNNSCFHLRINKY
uniref:Uncharacterized protein n=1 Tax=Lympha mucosa TaxID=2045360 RepID=A0A6B9VQH1_9FLOR|nr:hypothetical protein [Lympha mucosa]